MAVGDEGVPLAPWMPQDASAPIDADGGDQQ
jgi:hypothetical protein